jgi:hypothetical protein
MEESSLDTMENRLPRNNGNNDLTPQRRRRQQQQTATTDTTTHTISVSEWNSMIQQPQNNASSSSSSLVGFHRFYPSKIKQIVIIGERHSGTTFLTKYLKSCFINSLEVKDVFVNGKHWIQPTPEYVTKLLQKYGGKKNRLIKDDLTTWWDIHNSGHTREYFQNSLVISIYRNPYDWYEVFFFFCYHISKR